jgi:hypothetical protein
MGRQAVLAGLGCSFVALKHGASDTRAYSIREDVQKTAPSSKGVSSQCKQETILFLPVGPPYDGNPVSRRGMPIQYYADVKIPETILVPAAEGLGPELACGSLSVSEFVHAAFLRNRAARIKRK